ncbi:ABC transporter ATP-binding protein [Anaerosporobacter sp.]|uniref:ABC transporter ATP-binding protein n=1 Tax=Anaerosporobacter sp. TaxID=1872529 RepID=UPI00286F966D|nr:ABC transporter ATP-binding protein [Anaerosporobacter sp.]
MDIKNIDFSYGDRPLIRDLSATIEKGKITTIIGPNGSGKSTLLNLIIKQLQAKKGNILIDGKDITSCSYKVIAKQMAIVHQHNTAPEDLTVESLIAYGRTPYQSFWSSKDEDEEAVVAWALEVTKLKHLAKKPISQLSGGERQRAWIAMALAQKTDILLLDEPTTYLDIYYQLEVLNLVRELNKNYGITIVMVLHDINQAMQFSHNVIIMKCGTVVYAGDTVAGITAERLQEVYSIQATIRWCDKNCCPYIVPIAV